MMKTYGVLISEKLLDEWIVLQVGIDNDATHESIELPLPEEQHLLVVFKESRYDVRENNRRKTQE
jgi:hypothetical protein